MEEAEFGREATADDEASEEEHVAMVMNGHSVPKALLTCSNEDLCSSLAGELAAMDVHFSDRLEQIRDKYSHVIR